MTSKLLHPPRLAAWILFRICGSENRMSVVGDYEEMFLDLYGERGRSAARSWYRRQVLRSCPKFVINQIYGGVAMLKSYFKLGWRNILKHKKHSFLNIVGLAVGLAACLLITGFVIHEFNYENMHPLRDRIFRVNGLLPLGGEPLHNGLVAASLGPAVKASIPEVEACVRIRRAHDVRLLVGEKDFEEDKIFFAESEILEMFSIPLLRGGNSRVLEDPFTLILDESLARKYFGDRDPIGQTIKLLYGRPHDFKVTGVMRNMPSNTVLRIPMIASFATLEQLQRERMLRWEGWGSITTFVLLMQGTDSEAVGRKITSLVRPYLDDRDRDVSYYLQPLEKIYMQNETFHMNNDLDNGAGLARIYVFSVIALLILIVAAINFINLTTAKVAVRTKEVGIRKTCGALRSSLVRQFLVESFLITFVAMGLGLIFFEFFKPRFDLYLGKTLDFGILKTPWMLPVIVGMTLAVSLLAGSYPAFFLARFQAASVLRSGISSRASKSGIRRILVVFQFTVAITLIAVTVIVLNQVRYSKRKDLGFDPGNMILLKNRDASSLKNVAALKNEIMNRTGIISISSLAWFPSDQNRNISSFRTEAMAEDKKITAQTLSVDADFVTTMGLRLVSGRNFESGRKADENAVLINETAAAAYGIEGAAGVLYKEERSYRVIGILKDWHTNSIHSRIYPVVIFQVKDSAREFLVRIKPQSTESTLAEIREIWTSRLPGQGFDYAFVDGVLNRAYEEEQRLASLMVSFCQLTVLVACMGIFGLASYTTEQRTKEIGIRKVLGGSASGIVLLLTKGFVRWVLLANLVAWPAAYFTAHRWLQDFAYRIGIGISPFVLAGLLTLVVAVFSVIFQTFKAVVSDPVHSLRYE